MPTYYKIVMDKLDHEMNIRFEFRCSMNDVPETVGQLRRLVRCGEAILQGSYKGRQRRHLEQLNGVLRLETDWKAQGKPSMYINWIP